MVLFFFIYRLCISCAGCPDIGGWKIQSMCYNGYVKITSLEIFQSNTESKSNIVNVQDKISQNPIFDITQSIKKWKQRKKH